MLFNLDFAKNTILSCFFFFFLVIDLCFLIPTVIRQTFNPIVQLAIPTGIPTKEAKAEIETTHPVIVFFKSSIFFQSKFLIHVFFTRDDIFSDTRLYY